jgi:hypothetical protein
MPVMTMSGLKKQADVDREKKLEEEREKAQAEKNRNNGNGTNEVNGNGNGKFPTTILAELCRQGGGPTLAEMVMTVSPTNSFTSNFSER